MAIFLALALGILIGVSFGDNYLVSSQREIIDLMEQELGRRKDLLTDQEQNLKRWEQIKPLIWRSYNNSLNGQVIIVIAEDKGRAAEIRALLENTGAKVGVLATEDLAVRLESEQKQISEEASADIQADLYVFLLESDQSGVPVRRLSEQWLNFEQESNRVIVAYPYTGDEEPAIPEGVETYSVVHNIDTFWGQIALLEMAVYGVQGE